MTTPVSRHEFESAMKRLEALLEQQTEILMKLTSTEVSNVHRDQKIDKAQEAADKALEAVHTLRLLAAKAAGAGAVLVIIGDILLKKLGLL